MNQTVYGFRRHWGDFRDSLRGLRPSKLKGSPRYGLSETQVYPSGKNISNLLEKTTLGAFSTLGIPSSRKMASIGTCFAEEFAQHLKLNPELGNYLLVEENVFNSSANWGRVYTTENLLQIINYSLDENVPIHIEHTDKGFMDPLREYSAGFYDTESSAEEAIKKHRALSKRVLLETDILVITLGQNECWFDCEKSFFWGTTPSSVWLKAHPGRALPREIEYSRNLEIMEQCLQRLKSVNPNIKIILTVSPVPAAATFLSLDVVTQSMAGKSVLRAVAHEIQKSFSKDVFYFPSYEMVLCNNPKSFKSDNRHVRYQIVAKIFNLLGLILTQP